MTFRRYQEEDAAFYATQRHAFCLDDPRTGKTVKILLAAVARGADSLAVITRAITREQWVRECAKWAPGIRACVWGYEELTLSPARQRAFRDLAPDVLVIDEAQRLKSPDARRTRLVYGAGCQGTGLIASAGATWFLSGTLTPNHPGEVWTHLRALGVVQMGYYEFVTFYCDTYQGQYGLVVKGLKPHRVEEFKALFLPIARRRRYRDVFPNAAAPRWSPLPLTISAKDRARIGVLEQDAAMVSVRIALRKATTLEERMKILATAQPHTSTIRSTLSEIRAPLVADEAEALLESGVPKLVIMAWHHATMDVLLTRLAKYGAVRVDGTTRHRDALIQQFQTDTVTRVFIGQIQAAGEGIPLHAARVMLLAEWPWSAGDIVQATQRIMSGDCPDAPEIVACTLPGTIDDIVATTVHRKAESLGIFNTLEA